MCHLSLFFCDDPYSLQLLHSFWYLKFACSNGWFQCNFLPILRLPRKIIYLMEQKANRILLCHLSLSFCNGFDFIRHRYFLIRCMLHSTITDSNSCLYSSKIMRYFPRFLLLFVLLDLIIRVSSLRFLLISFFILRFIFSSIIGDYLIT